MGMAFLPQVEEGGTRGGTLGRRCPTSVAFPSQLSLQQPGTAVPATGPRNGWAGTEGGGVRVPAGGLSQVPKALQAHSPSGRAAPLNVMPTSCPSLLLDGSPPLHLTRSRCGKPSWPWWPCAG